MRRLFPLLALSLLLPLSGCDSAATSPEESVAGIWTLEAVNDSPLPWLAVEDELGKVEVIEGSIELLADGRFTDVTRYKLTSSVGVESNGQDLYTGRFVRTETGVTFSPNGFGQYTVTIEGETMKQILGTVELRYRK
jgi:hypothetical protein